MDDFNNMGGDLSVKADINVVDAPTAQNVVMDAPDPVTELLPTAESGISAAETAETGMLANEASPETAAEPTVFKVQSQEDYFANAFGYDANAQQTDAASNGAFGDANASSAVNYNGADAYGSANNYGGNGNYGNAGNYGGADNYGNSNTYGNSDTYGSTGNYGTENAYGTGNYNGTGTYGATPNYGGNYGNTNTYGNTGAYGNANAYGTTGTYNATGNGGYGYKTPTNSYDGGYRPAGISLEKNKTPANSYGGGYNSGYSSNQEYSGPDYYGSNVYANDAFASYYDDDMPERKSNGLAIGALVCGIVSLSLTCSGIGIVPGIIAIILGIRGAKECEKVRMANIGMILGIVGSVVNLIRLAAFILQLTTSILDYF